MRIYFLHFAPSVYSSDNELNTDRYERLIEKMSVIDGDKWIAGPLSLSLISICFHLILRKDITKLKQQHPINPIN